MTDTDVVLGYVPAEGFAGGRMQLDVDAARAAIERDVADPLGIDVVDAAWGIERIVNANMANATRRVLASHGADPRTLAMIAYGGNGAVHAAAIAAELGIEPRPRPEGCAGVLRARRARRRLRRRPRARRTSCRSRKSTSVASATLMAELHDEVAKELEPAGLADGRRRPRPVRADVLPGPELRHERARARR